jgi:hypothetical protein
MNEGGSLRLLLNKIVAGKQEQIKWKNPPSKHKAYEPTEVIILCMQKCTVMIRALIIIFLLLYNLAPGLTSTHSFELHSSPHLSVAAVDHDL